MRREPLEPRLAVDEPPGEPPRRRSRVDLVVRDLVARSAPARSPPKRNSVGPSPDRAASSRASRPGKWTKAIRTAGGGYRRYPPGSMHRQRTKLAKRVNRVASAVERRGIVATYELHERLLGNRSARRQFAVRTRRSSTRSQRGLVEALDREGYVTLPFTDLVDEESGRRIEAQGAAFVAETERTIAEGGQGKVRAGKEFVVRAHSFEGATLGADDAVVLGVASRRMLDVANAYLRLWAKLSYVDLWYTAQQPATDERVASQNWHVDFDDKHLLKAFVYLSDVGADHGPFEYVPGQPARRSPPLGAALGADGLRPRRRRGRRAERPARRDRHASPGPKGTLILCNTSGLHRGGFATAGPRVLATATYCSPASLKALSNRNYDTPLADDDRPGRPLRRLVGARLDVLGRPVEQRAHAAAELTREEALRRVAEARVA